MYEVIKKHTDEENGVETRLARTDPEFATLKEAIRSKQSVMRVKAKDGIYIGSG